MKMATIAGQMLDKKYQLGGTSGESYDCLSFLFTFYGLQGITLPDKFNGWTLGNYAERWEAGQGKEVFYEYLHSLGRPIKENYMTDKDLLLLDTEEGVTPAICLGSGNIMIVTIEQGVFVMPVNMLQCQIKEVRRLG